MCFPKVKLPSDLEYFCIRWLKWLIWNLVIRQLRKKTGPKIWCSAVNCSKNKRTHPELGFFRFPSDPERYVYFSNIFTAYSNFKLTRIFLSFVLIPINAENNLDQKNGWCYVDVKISWVRPCNTCTTANCAQITLKIACFITTYVIAWSQMQNLLCSTSQILLPKLLWDAVYYKGIPPPVPLQVIAVQSLII